MAVNVFNFLKISGLIRIMNLPIDICVDKFLSKLENHCIKSENFDPGRGFCFFVI